MASTFLSHLVWSGALQPARNVESFSRDLTVRVGGATLPMSAAPDFYGDASRANPEQLFVASLSACQALTYLFLAARNTIAVLRYTDDAIGTLGTQDGHLCMTHVVLRPRIVVADEAATARARELVEKAHRACFIANSVATAVTIEPLVEIAECAA